MENNSLLRKVSEEIISAKGEEWKVKRKIRRKEIREKLIGGFLIDVLASIYFAGGFF